jgi:uncharacterized membrane protein YcaP (DUF421 family)
LFLDDLSSLGRTLVVGVLAYVALVIILRVSGKRTLSKWNAFDFVVTIAIGSMLATTLVNRSTTLAQGVVGLTLLVAIQFIITWLAVRYEWLRRTIKDRPALLVYRGRFRDQALRRERVTRGEVMAAVRGHGVAAVEDVHAVVLETDGSFSVIQGRGEAAATALVDVEGFDGRLGGHAEPGTNGQ